MAIKIKKNGIVQDLVINASEVRVLDTDGNFRSKNLESVLKELNATGGTGTGGGMLKEAEYVFVGDTEPDYEGVWLDTSEDSTEVVEGDNAIVKAIRDYIDTDVKATVDKNKELVHENNEIVKDIQTNVGDRLDVVPQLSNPNLLINSYFLKPINQRGSTNYNEWGKYTIDRWINRTKSVEIQSDGILITMDAQYGSIAQIFEDVSIFKNKTVTLSGELEVIEGNVYSDLNVADSNSNGHINCYKSFDIGQHSFSVTSTLDNDISKLTLGIINRIEGTSKVKLKWLKLELGSVATPFTPRNIGEELALCQRYYYQWSNERARYRADGINTNQLIFTVPLPTTMRIAPTLDNSFAINQIGGANISDFTFGCVNSPIGVLIYATKTNHGLTDGQLMISDNGNLDAEIY